MNLTDPAIAAPVDPISAAIGARTETLEAKIAIAWKDCERDQIAAGIEASKRLLRKLMH
jgi:hypothetical protein